MALPYGGCPMPPNLQVHKLSPALLLEGENALENVTGPMKPSVKFDASLRPSLRERHRERERERKREFQEIHLDRMNGALGFRPMTSSPRSFF
jgi:hypothetical protein